MEKYLNLTGLTYFWGKVKGYITTQLNGKVDVVEGKGLSTNDLTGTLKSNYDAAYTHAGTAHAPTTAQANVLETVKKNGVALSVTGKAVDISVPTTVAELTDAGNYALKSEVATIDTITNTEIDSIFTA